MKENNNDIQKEVLIKIQEMNDIINKVKELKNYNANSKNKINDIAKKMAESYKGDWRGHCLKTSLKKDLINNIIIVCESNIKSLESKNETMLKENESSGVEKFEKDKKELANELALKIYHYKNEYIKSFDNISEGIRQWSCLYDLIETGYVLEEDVLDYGVDLSVPPKK